MFGYDFVAKMQAHATATGWHSVLKFDKYEENARLDIDYNDGAPVLTFDVLFVPSVKNGKVYRNVVRCLAALGQKVDITTDDEGEAVGYTVADIEESHLEKYDRRLGSLTRELIDGMAAFACAEGAGIEFGSVAVEVNAFDANIDFVVSEITFTYD